MNQENNNLNTNNMNQMSETNLNQQPMPQIQSTMQSQYISQTVQPQYQEPVYNQSNNNKNNKGKNLIIFIVIGVVVLGGLIFGGYKLLIKSTNDSVEKLDLDAPIKVENDGKYGYIDTEGNIIIEAKYKYVSDVFDNKIVVSNDNEYSSYGKYEIMNTKGEVLYTAVGDVPRYYPNTKVWLMESKIFDSNLNQITEDGASVKKLDNGFFEKRINYKSSVINSTNQTIIELNKNDFVQEIFGNTKNEDYYILLYDYSLDLDKKSYKLYSVKTKKYIDINCESVFVDRDVLECRNDTIISFIYYKDGKEAYRFDVNKESEYSYQPDVSLYDDENEILQVENGSNYKNEIGKENTYEYYDVKNKKILTSYSIPSESESLSISEILTKNGFEYKEGVVYKNGKALYDNELGYINYILNPVLEGNLKGKMLVLLEKYKEKKYIYTLYDLNSKKILFQAEGFLYSRSKNTPFLVFEKNSGYTSRDDDELTIYNLITQKSTKTGLYEYIYIYDNYMTTKYKDEITYYNIDLKEIYKSK